MTQAVVQVRNIVARSGFANPLTLAVLVADPDYVKVYADTTLLDDGTDYEITGIGDPNGVSIEIIGAEDPDNYVGTINFVAVFDPPLDQQADLSAGGVLGRNYESGLDQQNRRLQALGDQVKRAIKLPVTVDGDIVLDEPVDQWGLVWDDATQTFIWAPVNDAGSQAASLPIGGTPGQLLRKASDSDFDTEWFTGAFTADAVAFVPAGSVAATTVQTAIEELDSEKLSVAAAALAYQALITNTAKQLGAVGDGVADDRAAIAAADALDDFIIGPGSYNLGSSLTLTNSALLVGADLSGSGLFGHYAGLRGRRWYQRADRTSGMYTDTPSVYTYIHELAGYHVEFNNAAGYQEFVTTDSGGRTMVPVFDVVGTHTGYGDLNAYQASIGVSAHATWGSATSWTGRNSATVVGGHVGANTDGPNLYAAEFVVDDNSNDDVAGLGIILNFSRTGVQNAAYRTPWLGIRLQAPLSTQRLDAMYQGLGAWRVGLDFAGATFDTTQSAIALAQNQRIYFGAAAHSAPSWYAGDTGASLGTTYVDYNGTHLRGVVGGNATLLLSTSQATVAGILAVSGNAFFGNTALRIADTNASHYLIFAGGSDLSADRTLTITTGDANRTLDLTKIVNNDVSNTFSATQNISGSAAFFTGLNIISTDASASGGPYFVLRRDSASPAVNDNGPGFIFQMRDSGNNLTNVGGLSSLLLDPTDGSEDSEIQATAYVAGSAVVALAWSNGVKIGAPTSGYMGTGTLNLDNDLYKDGVKVVGARDTGWTAMTGTPDESTAYATGSVTLPQLAGRVMALQTALTTHGLIGA